jgi:hypothetical protein
MGGDARGSDADPSVHAVRVRDVLRPGGLRGAARRFDAHADVSASPMPASMHSHALTSQRQLLHQLFV